MKYSSTIFFLSLLALFSCETSSESATEEEIPENRMPFNITFDMTTDDVKELYSDCDFVLMHPNHYGLCSGGEDGIEVIRNDTVLFYYWENWKDKKVDGFILLDPKQSFKGVYVGMKLNEYLVSYPDAKTGINLISSKEGVNLDGGNGWINLETDDENYAAEYNFDEGEAEFIQYIDKDKKIESIFVSNPN